MCVPPPVDDWDMLEDIWQYALKDRLCSSGPEHAELIAEHSFAPKADRCARETHD